MQEREFILNAQATGKEDDLKRIAYMANLDGLSGKQIQTIETETKFGIGIKVKFIYKAAELLEESIVKSA